MVAPTAAAPPPAGSGAWWRAWLRLIRFDRPIGTLLVLWPTLWGLWLASEGEPDPLVFAVFMAGVFLMRSAGCAINDFADRRIDGHVARTQGRPLATGELTASTALWTAVVLTLIAFGLVLLMNPLTIALSVVAAFLAGSYPFTKRITHLPQFYLGVAFGWAVPMAFAAQTGQVPALAWIVFAAVVLWAAAYDTMYAMVDREDDLAIGVKSTAVLFGRFDVLIVTALLCAVIGVLLAAGVLAGRGGWFYGGMAVAAGQALYQVRLIRSRDPQPCFKAFLSNDAFGRFVFIGLALDYLFS
ncbi:MAG: 4-hydroxybenzoate octaprenyltransferase [Pseudomonadota bacterium]